MLKLFLKLKVVVKHLRDVCLAVVFVYVLKKVGLDLFSGCSSHKAYYKGSVIVILYVIAAKFKVEIKLEDLILKLVLISIVKVRSSNLTARLSFLSGVY